MNKLDCAPVSTHKFKVGQTIRDKDGFTTKVNEISEMGYHCTTAYIPFAAEDKWEIVETRTMDYEKAYKQALEEMRDCIPDKDGYVTIRPGDIFPELKESEDERIRRVLIDGFMVMGRGRSDTTFGDHKILIVDILAWLEKQAPKEVDGFDAELNALLKKYEHLPKEEVAECLRFYLGVVDGKPKWTDADEENLQHCCGAIHAADYYTPEDKEEMGKWLKSLKGRVQPQPVQEWSDEDERLMNFCINKINDEYDEISKDRFGHSEIISDLKEGCRERINWLKSLKKRIGG